LRLDGVAQRLLRVDRLRRNFVRRVPRERERDAVACLDAELGDRPQVLASVLDFAAETECVGAGHSDPRRLCRASDPRERLAVIEADHELGIHRHLAVDALDDADDVRRLSARWHEIDDAHLPGVALPVRLEDERPFAVPPLRLPRVSVRRDDPATVLARAEQRGEARAESKRGKHAQSIEPSRPTSAAVCRSPMSP
jgi:hypothetical protein